MDRTEVQGNRTWNWFLTRCTVDAQPCLRLVAAFAAIYLIWGSTYLAIRFAIESIPPFLMAGTRFLIAGGLLYAWTRLRGAPRPKRIHWREAAIIGGLMLLGGNGAVTWAEQRIPSGLAALLIAAVPMWIVLLEALRPGGARPSVWTVVGLAMGLAGVALLIGPGNLGGGQHVDLVGALVILIGALAWAIGSLYSRQAQLPSVSLQGVALEMLAGGLLLVLAGGITGEVARLDVGNVSPRSLMAMAYLIVFGSIIAFTAYVWLLRATTPARASTYAYVNPVVAVLLGWALANEPLTVQTLISAAVIVSAVAIITTARPAGLKRDKSP